MCIEDISARKATEGALRRLNETLEATVAERTHELDSIWRHSRDMLCVARFSGTFLRLNPAWADTLGWAKQELLDTPFIDLVHPDDQQRTRDAMAVLGEGATVPGFENRYPPQGRRLPVVLLERPCRTRGSSMPSCAT